MFDLIFDIAGPMTALAEIPTTSNNANSIAVKPFRTAIRIKCPFYPNVICVHTHNVPHNVRWIEHYGFTKVCKFLCIQGFTQAGSFPHRL